MASPVDFTKVLPGSAEWWLRRLAGRLLGRQSPMAVFDDYYHGRHRSTFKVRQVLDAFGLRDPLHVNYCAVVVDSLNERLGIQGFRVGDDEKGAAAAWEIWQRNQLDAGFKRGMRSGLVKSEFSLMVWPDPDGEPCIYVEDGSQVIVATDPSDRSKRLAALKRWRDEDLRQTFANVYLKDGIYKFELPVGDVQTPEKGALPSGFMRRGGAGTPQPLSVVEDTGAWERRLVENEPWPVPNPMNEVPVIPIPNKPDLAGIGESEIALVVPIQDAINANIANVMLAGLYGAFRQKWATNVVLKKDEKTAKIEQPWDVALDSLITAPPPQGGAPETRFGEFGQSDLDGYVKLHELYVQAIATATRLPPHYLLGSQGTFPSGEALIAVEVGLSEKAKERAIDFADPVETVMRLALRVKAAQAGLSKARSDRYLKWAAAVDSEIVPKDPQTRTESSHADALVKLQGLGVPQEALWAKIPASPQEIAEWKALVAAAEAAAPPVQSPPAPGTAGALIDPATGQPYTAGP